MLTGPQNSQVLDRHSRGGRRTHSSSTRCAVLQHTPRQRCGIGPSPRASSVRRGQHRLSVFPCGWSEELTTSHQGPHSPTDAELAGCRRRAGRLDRADDVDVIHNQRSARYRGSGREAAERAVGAWFAISAIAGSSSSSPTVLAYHTGPAELRRARRLPALHRIIGITWGVGARHGIGAISK